MNDYTQNLANWGGKKILFVMASPYEYGEHLKATGIKPLITGVGMNNAASKLAAALATLKERGTLPDLVISLGTAGCQDRPVNQVYEVSKIRNADMDASALGYKLGVVPDTDGPSAYTIPNRFGLPAAECYSTNRYDHLVPSKGHSKELEEMEFSAIIDVCNNFNIPPAGLKGVSNNRDTIHASSNSWEKYCEIIDPAFAKVVNQLKHNLENNEISNDKLLAMQTPFLEKAFDCEVAWTERVLNQSQTATYETTR